MEVLFLKILNMSITATYVLVAVLVLRLLLKRTPKWISYSLWCIVLFRLICPISLSSAFSIFGSLGKTASVGNGIEHIPADVGMMVTPQMDIGTTSANTIINNALPAATPAVSVNPMQMLIFIGTCLWLTGVTVMLIYSVVSYLRLKHRMREATLFSGNVFETDKIASPFVCGLIKPKIYLPVGLSDNERHYVLRHEQTHIARRDHLIKPLAFLVLSVHWFNPFMWLAFILMSRDLEMSCDEKVVSVLDSEGKAGYSSALIQLAMKRPILAGSPLAFGESGAKGRVKNVLNYKKPAFWVLIVSTAAVILVAVPLLTNPIKTPEPLDASSPNTIYALAPTYAFDECLYMNPLSSYYPVGTTGQIYLFNPDGAFTIISEETREIQESISLIDWTGKEVDTKEWNSLFNIGNPVDLSSYSVRKQYKAADKYRIYQMDEEVWLATIREGSIWSLYRLKDTTRPDFESGSATTKLEPTSPKLAFEQEVGVDMVELDYASDDIVIFHDYFGLFVYDLNSKKIVRSLDLNPIGCTATQGDNYCDVTVSADGNTVQLHPMSSKNMYSYTVSDNTLQETVYVRMENRFTDFVDIVDVIDFQKAGNYSHTAVKFDTGEYGYLHTSDWTLGTLTYVRGGDMLYRLFGFGESSSASAPPSPAAEFKTEKTDSVKFFVTTSPGKYTPAMSSTPGLQLDITYDGPTAQILYEAETGGFITWQNSVIEDLGNSVTRPADASALYWRPNSDTPQDDVITLTILNEAGEKIAGSAFAITKGDDGFFTAFSKSPENLDIKSSSATVEPWELISRAFAVAFFEKNTEVMKSYLLDPDKGFYEYNLGNGLSDIESMKLKFNPNDIKSDSVSAQYEFKFDGDDSYTYLQLSMKKVNDVWKIESYGLEK